MIRFGSNCSAEKPFTNDATELEKAVLAVSARGRTALYDAVAEGLNHLQLGHWDKKALIIVSDGGDNASAAHVLADPCAGPAIADVDLFDRSSGRARRRTKNPDVLKRLCKNTGGIAYFPGP